MGGILRDNFGEGNCQRRSLPEIFGGFWCLVSAVDFLVDFFVDYFRPFSLGK